MIVCFASCGSSEKSSKKEKTENIFKMYDISFDAGDNYEVEDNDDLKYITIRSDYGTFYVQYTELKSNESESDYIEDYESYKFTKDEYDEDLRDVHDLISIISDKSTFFHEGAKIYKYELEIIADSDKWNESNYCFVYNNMAYRFIFTTISSENIEKIMNSIEFK